MTTPSPSKDRPFDVVLFGATGFTGKLTAEYLAEHAHDDGVTWAIAGRSRDKLEAVRRDLAKKSDELAELPILVADAHDPPALDRLARRTRVVCTTVGPYAEHGLALALSCARNGTSYCDLTGEPNYVRALIDQCHDIARGTEARLVPCSGFDSVPSDLGAFIAWDHARSRHGEGLSWCKIFTGRMRGAMSGGTVATMLGILEAAKRSPELRRLLLDPHALDPERAPCEPARVASEGVLPCEPAREPFEADQRTIRFDRDAGLWTAPFVMATINTRVVRRSHALLREEGGGYGQHFLYNEAMGFGSGPRGLAKASLVTAGIGALFATAAIGPARALLERLVLPKPGEGPSREEIESGFFEMKIVACTESGKPIRGRIAGTQDPGYGETAKMLAETAISLAKDGARLEPRFGVLTSATALGKRLVERLRGAGMTFDVHDA